MTRTLLMWKTAAPPADLYELVRESSTIVFLTEATNAPVRLFVDHVVVWNDSTIEVDRRMLFWPADAKLVRLLLGARSRRRPRRTTPTLFTDRLRPAGRSRRSN